MLGNIHADVVQRLLFAVEQAQAGYFDGDGFLGQAQALFVAAKGRHVDAVAMGFLLHGRLHTLTNSVRFRLCGSWLASDGITAVLM
ncbi:hypothetical protein D9M72_638780 [compost metagenome]